MPKDNNLRQHIRKVMEKTEEELLCQWFNRIHKILNETVFRKLTIKEYTKLVNLIGKVYKLK